MGVDGMKYAYMGDSVAGDDIDGGGMMRRM